MRFDIAMVPNQVVGHLLYALHFCDESIVSFRQLGTVLEVEASGASGELERRVQTLIARFAQSDLDFQVHVLSSSTVEQRSTAVVDPYRSLVEQGLVVEIGGGRCVLRGWMARLVEAIDAEARCRVARPAGAEPEAYPNAITCEVLARTNHISSFPEHLHFVSHLHSNLDLIDKVGGMARGKSNWDAELAQNVKAATASPHLVLNPSVCYHCYASRAGTMVGESIVVTARSRCHRYEGGALQGLRRLSDFDMREVIFLGHPDRVREHRTHAEEALVTWATEWDLAADLVTANDPFFTDEFEVKAAFQRRQELKHELVVPMPEGAPMAISSSNYHSTTFGKAFGITRSDRPACTGCIGFGLERWAYAIVLRHGLDVERWPETIRAALARH